MDGKPVRLAGPKDAIKHGVGIIYQELDLVPEFSVGENIFLADEPRAAGLSKIGILSRKTIFTETAHILSGLGFEIDPRSKVGSLSIGEQQLVQIIKAIRLSAKVLVMDEPTARLAHDETQTLFKIMTVLKEKGVSIIYISHHMEEIMQIADRVSVLRDGQVVGTVEKTSTSLSEIVRMVVGKELSEGITRPEISKGAEILAVNGLTLDGCFSDISFKICSGEILGIGGLVGSGRTEIAHCVFGVEKPTSGEIIVGGQKVKIRSPLDAIKKNIILIPEERKAQGLILNHSVMSNLSLAYLRIISRYQLINGRERQQSAQRMVNRLKIKTPSLNQEVGNLSGGNQQKVVLGKWLPLKPMVVILDQPTRGIDVGAKREIYDLISELAQNGSGIIMISDELPELIGLADRIMVIGKGRKAFEFNRGEVNQSQLLEAVVSHEKMRAAQP
jgi:ribose transport system ATP-binding protein